MKRFLFIIALFACTAIAHAQTMEWPALKTFHGVISQTYHPSEEGNLAPAKQRSKEIYDDAKQLATSSVPAAYQSPKMKEALSNLEKEAAKFNDMVTKMRPDPEIKKQLSVVHDAFHEVAGLCKEEKH
ncbi:hypothetical protein [Taibaiella soli]|uniref:Uncharacterized protein n=1 Tax=Taibaiella soli TaxID=1649169 RepID=A0A2W2BF76_9BACT|nr:hypothetical protein [Taibaiella soli]PZF74557.1 hypothetical protein DN068_02990 [Taibaiella soli]